MSSASQSDLHQNLPEDLRIETRNDRRQDPFQGLFLLPLESSASETFSARQVSRPTAQPLPSPSISEQQSILPKADRRKLPPALLPSQPQPLPCQLDGSTQPSPLPRGDTRPRSYSRPNLAQLPTDNSTPQLESSLVGPAAPTSFVGDAANSLLRVLVDLTLLDPLPVPLVFYGPSQTGKTVLANALAHRWARNLFFRRRLFSRRGWSGPQNNQNPAAQTPHVDRDDADQLDQLNQTDQRPEAVGRTADDSHSAGDSSQAIETARQFSGARPICLSGFDWGLQLREAIVTNSLTSFHQRFMQAGAVLLDNLQQLRTSPFAQSQLVLLIDHLEAAGIPLIFTLDQAPHELSEFSSDLTSRLQGGLVLPITFPGQVARRKLALDWMAELQLKLDPDALAWLLDLPQASSYPGLLGALRKLQLASSTSPATWSLPAVQTALSRPPAEANSRWTSLIIETTAAQFELTPDILLGPSRRQTAVLARGLALTLIRAICNYSLAELGSLFGNRDHSTVMNALESTPRRLAGNPQIRPSVARLIAQLKQLASLEQLPFPEQSLPPWLNTPLQ